MLSPFECLCGNFILPEPASYVSFFALFNLRNLLYLILLPLSFILSKIIKVDFQNKGNPLTNLGVLFSVNQILYLLIAMWIYPTVPEKMLMVIAIIFGAHLMPYSWLYKSKSYFILSIIIPIAALIIGLKFEPFVLAILMIGFEVLFSILLINEVKKIEK